MPDKKEIAQKIAEYLLQIKAIKLQPHQPFTWSSGWRSPIYCDNRVSLSYPKIRTFIRQALATAIEEQYGKPDVIAGVATAAIAQGVLVAEQMGLPFIYVRLTQKEHGKENIIEGEIKAGQSVVVVEDLVSTGGSSLKAVNALRDKGAIVKGMVSIFTYGFESTEENFKRESCQLYSLCDYNVLIKQAIESNYIKENDLKTLNDWRLNPDNWGRKIHKV